MPQEFSLLHVHCVLRTLPGILCQYAGSASGLYQSKIAVTSGCALHIILCTDACRHISQTHTRTHRDRDACLDGCTHNVS